LGGDRLVGWKGIKLVQKARSHVGQTILQLGNFVFGKFLDQPTKGGMKRVEKVQEKNAVLEATK